MEDRRSPYIYFLAPSRSDILPEGKEKGEFLGLDTPWYWEGKTSSPIVTNLVLPYFMQSI